MKITLKSYWPAIVWLILATIAFFLPGKALPQKNWFGQIQLDKWIHVGIFSVMITLWCLPLLTKTNALKILMAIALGFFSYGIFIEFIQHFFIPNRSFDIGDIAADAAGCLIGFFFVRWQQKK